MVDLKNPKRDNINMAAAWCAFSEQAVEKQKYNETLDVKSRKAISKNHLSAS